MAGKKSGSLDTNLLLRLVLGDVPKQAEAVEKLLASSGSFNVSDITLVEMVFVLEKVYHLPRKVVVENMRAIIQHDNIECNRKLFAITLTHYLEFPKLSIVDCVLTRQAELGKATPLYTFDADLAKSFPSTSKLL